MKPETENKIENVCNLNYLSDMMGGKKHLIMEIMDDFVKQISEELKSINHAVAIIDYKAIKNFTHTMKSTVSIMGINVLEPILQEMENLGVISGDIKQIKKLNQQLNLICIQAMEEIEKEKQNYV